MQAQALQRNGRMETAYGGSTTASEIPVTPDSVIESETQVRPLSVERYTTADVPVEPAIKIVLPLDATPPQVGAEPHANDCTLVQLVPS